MISVSLEGSDIPGLRALSVHEEDGLHKPTSLTSQILKSAKKGIKTSKVQRGNKKIVIKITRCSLLTCTFAPLLQFFDGYNG